MIPLLAPVTVTRQRFGPSVTVDGYAQPTTPVETAIVAALCPTPDRVRQNLPDGYRSATLITLVSYSEIIGADDVADTMPDRLVSDTGTYEVVRVERAPAFLGQPEHWRVTAAQVQPLQYPGATGSAPANTAVPVVYGAGEAPVALACLPGTWTGTGPLVYAYQWQRNGVDVPGQVAQTVTATLAGTWRCGVTVSGSVGSPVTAYSAGVVVTVTP
jgi:hypothetical protein